MVTNILVRILACRNAPTKSNCLTLALIRLAWARDILRLRNEAVGDHLSSVIFLSCKSPLTTNLHLSLSNDPSPFTFTLKVSIMGVLVSPEFRVSGANVPESISVLSSFLIAFSHSCQTIPSFIFRTSRIFLGAGSQEVASPVLGCRLV